MENLTKEEKELVKSTEKIYGPKAQEVLRRYKKNAKEDRSGECQWCVRNAETLIPIKINICRKCMERIHARYGKIHVLGEYFTDLKTGKKTFRAYKTSYYTRKICGMCGGGDTIFYDCNIKVCMKCINLIGRINKFWNEHYKNAWGNKPISRTVDKFKELWPRYTLKLKK